MSRNAGSTEYACARIAARSGRRACALDWQRVQSARTLAAALQAARECTLARWLHGLDGAPDVHVLERALRRRWREAVAEVAAWMAPAWQPCIDWCARLADLGALEQSARGEDRAAWTDDDPWLRAASDREAVAPGDASAVAWRWLTAWRALRPGGAHGAREGDAIETDLLPLLLRHQRAFADPAAIDGWGQRRALDAQLTRLRRRHAQEPVASFAHLALEALELERLRAELVGRAAFDRRVLHTA